MRGPHRFTAIPAAKCGGEAGADPVCPGNRRILNLCAHQGAAARAAGKPNELLHWGGDAAHPHRYDRDVIATRLARVPPLERGLTLGDFLVPIRLGERASSWQRHLLMVVIGMLLIALGARISFYLPTDPVVPVTLQTFGVLFGAALLGFRRALAAVGLYLLLGIVGLPIFALDAQTGVYRSGLDTIVHVGGGAVSLAPTGGYLVGFLFAGGLVGRLAELGWDRHIGGSVGAMVLGNAVIYLVGVPWLMASAHQSLSWGLQYGLWPFLTGDLLKLAVAAGLLPVGWWLVERRSSDL
jgi:biotin transport system substrate-specific component